MKRLVIAAVATCLALAGCAGAPSSSTSAAKVYDIGIAQIVAHPSLDDLREGFKEGMAKRGFVEGTNVKYTAQNASGDQATLAAIASSFKSKDLIVAIATPTAQALAQAIPDKPIFFAGVTDPVAAKLVASLERPGGNLTGTSDFPPVVDQLKLIKEILPNAKSVGLLYSSAETNSHAQARMVKDAAPALGLEVREATVANAGEVSQAALSLSGVDVFFVGTDNTIVSAIESVVQVAESTKVPLIVSDPDSVVRGALAAYAVDYRAQGVQTGEMAAAMLLANGTPATIPVERAKDLKLSLNPAAAARMGVTIPPAVLAKAQVTVG